MKTVKVYVKYTLTTDKGKIFTKSFLVCDRNTMDTLLLFVTDSRVSVLNVYYDLSESDV